MSGCTWCWLKEMKRVDSKRMRTKWEGSAARCASDAVSPLHVIWANACSLCCCSAKQVSDGSNEQREGKWEEDRARVREDKVTYCYSIFLGRIWLCLLSLYSLPIFALMSFFNSPASYQQFPVPPIVPSLPMLQLAGSVKTIHLDWQLP